MKVKNKKPTKKYLNPTVQLVAAVLLFVAATIASRGVDLSLAEEKLFYIVYNMPAIFYPLMLTITQLGSVYILGILVVIYAYKRHYHIVLRLLLTGALAYLLAGLGKSLWGRGRPHEFFTDVFTLDYFQGAGFPSGHVALATALALTMGHYLPRKYHWVPVACIIGVALSRMYLGVHLPLDIIGGFALGWISYALFRHVRIYDITFSRPKGKRPPRRTAATARR